MAKLFMELLADERGATGIEYGLLVAVISIAGISSFQWLGDTVVDVFSPVSAELRGVTETIEPGGGTGGGTGGGNLVAIHDALEPLGCDDSFWSRLTRACR